MKELLRKIKNKLRERGIPMALSATLYARQPKLTARILCWSVLAVNPESQASHVVLCLARSIFTDDIRAMATYSGRIKYIAIHREFLRHVLYHFWSKKERTEIFENNYHSTLLGREGVERYKKYLEKMFPIMKKKLGFEAVLVGNIGYVEHQEFSKVCEANSVPFIVLHKEALVVEDAYHVFLNNYREMKFFGSRIMFYNEQCRRGFLGLGIKGLSEEKTSLVGIPRFDYLFDPAKTAEMKNQITLFSFLPRFSFRFITKDEALLQALEKRTIEFFRLLMQYAKDHPDTMLVIKTKNAAHYLEFPDSIYRSMFPDGIGNVRITNSEQPSDLIFQSRSIAGFNSTTLIEALAAGKRVISPYYGDLMPEQSWSFFEGNEAAVQYVRTYDELESSLSREYREDTDFSEARKKLLEKYIATANGGAASKAEDIIINEIVR